MREESKEGRSYEGSLLLVSIGPIQDFIASARRCQDLWFGSWLLSELAQTTAEAVEERIGATRGSALIFPAGLGSADERGVGVANLILAILPPGRSGAEVADHARERQQARLREIADAAWSRLDDTGLFRRDIAMQQVSELMELQWVAVEGTGDYAADRKVAYKRLAAIKNTRVWTQPPWTDRAGAGVPKSSLDGERESVIDARAEKEMNATQRRRRFGLKGKEQLCGVGLLKRLGHDVDAREFRTGRPAFHSTAHVAALPLTSRIGQSPAVDEYLGALQELGLDVERFRIQGGRALGGHDGNLLFPSRLEEHFETEAPGFAELGIEDRKKRLKEAQAALQKLMRAVAGPSEPCPYYAFLLADGDNMGAAIDRIGTPDGHRALGAALNTFSSDCRGVVSRHGGSLIFAGGDDVLALLPLHTALECARELAESFASTVQPAAPGDGAKPTLSVGLGISHCREPMSEARKLAKRAEKLAKAHVGKNALAVIVAKRSGGDLALVGGWAGGSPLDLRLASWVRELDRGELSSKTAHDLEGVAVHYQSLSRQEQTQRTGEILSLAREVLGRKRRRGGAADLARQHVEALLASIAREDGRPVTARVRDLSAELQVARLLSHGRRDAGLTSLQPSAAEEPS